MLVNNSYHSFVCLCLICMLYANIANGQRFGEIINYDEQLGLGVCAEDEDRNALNLESITNLSAYNVNDSDYDPIIRFQKRIDIVLFGTNVKSNVYVPNLPVTHQDFLTQYPTGRFMHAETVGDSAGAHMPYKELIFRGHSTLNITEDKLQTALDAFFLFVYGTIGDIASISPTFILNSAKTIAMLKISMEKKVAIWNAVKGGLETEKIPFAMLELYRPLLRYVPSRELAKLNLSDPKILSYLGTHPELNRHQVGIIANKYINMNPNWKSPKYLNLMNNVMCGVPIMFMRRIPMNSYLQLNHQVFYHISACDKLQQRFFLNTMSKAQALGKPFSWNAQDVARLGYLMTELKGSELTQIRPEAMAGLTAQVMIKMKPENLVQLTNSQKRYLNPRALNIYAKKIKMYEDKSYGNGADAVMLKICCREAILMAFQLYMSSSSSYT